MDEEEPIPSTSTSEPKKPKKSKKAKSAEPKKVALPSVSVTGDGLIHVRAPKSPKPDVPHVRPPKLPKPVVFHDSNSDDSEGPAPRKHKIPKKSKSLKTTPTNATETCQETVAEDLPKFDGNVLFCDDKPTAPIWRFAKDFITVAMDEIALEGLDGITLEALWSRMSVALNQTLPFTKSLEKFVWESVRALEDFDFYELPTPRPKLIVFDRFPTGDLESNGYLADDEPEDIYVFSAVNDRVNGILGSCAMYNERKCISDEARTLDLDAVLKKFGSKLVIVASQKLRQHALIPDQTNPLIVSQLNDMQYCILERIGRSRRQGELTCGLKSLTSICKDSKTLFYYRKILHKNQLISKQQFCLNRKNKQNTIGNLFHLHRFFNERKSRKQTIIEHIIKLLKTRPTHRMEYIEMRRIVGNDNWEKLAINKLVKSNDFKQVVRTDLNLMYREVYPNAKESEWKRKANAKEKMVRVFELINPNVNINAMTKEDDQKDSSSDEDAYDNFAYNFPIAKQAYDIIYESGSSGVFLKQLQSLVGSDFYSVRALTKALIKNGLIYSSMVDAGRQRYTKFYALCFKEKNAETLPSRTIKPFEEEEHDDETLNFIADILCVDASNLKEPRAPEESLDLPENPFKGRYDEIRMLRLQNKELDEIEKFRVRISEESHDNLEKMERKRIIQDIYTNRHNFIDHNTSLNEGIIIRTKTTPLNTNDEFKTAMAGVFKLKKPVVPPIFSEKTTPNAASINPLLENKLKRSQTVTATKKIRKFSQYLTKIISKKPDIMPKNYKSYLQLYKSVMESLIDHAKPGNQPEYLLSTDSEEGDDNSLNVNLEYTDDYRQIESAEPEIKQLLIDFFDTDESLLQKLGETGIIKLELADIKRPRSSDGEEETEKRPKLEESPVETKPKVKQPEQIFKLEVYMGPNPRTISDEIDEDGIQTKVMVSSNPSDFSNMKKMTLSERVEKRCELIKEAVLKHRIIPDISKLLQMLITSEKKEGYFVKVDRKSIFRIYTKLVREGAIKMVKIFVKYENIVRSKSIIVFPNVDIQTFIDSAIEQFKMSFFLYAKRKIEQSVEDVPVVPTIPNDAKEVRVPSAEETSNFEKNLDRETGNKVKYRYSRTVGKSYGYYPKVAKMRVLHEFLYYLLYSYDGKVVPNEEVAEVLKQHCDNDDKLASECSVLYQREASWKMFVPPIPEHKTWANGWLLICDALLRLPISIFMKIFNVTYIIPELPKHYLNHPVRKHFLVKNLPPDTRDAILNYRKYIFSIYEVFCYLCYLGLLQFGPQKFREKDQQFVFLNKNGMLYDTSTSDVGYHHVTLKEYPKLTYCFNSVQDVDKYWSDMYEICMHTRLGQRTSVMGKYISLENIHGKPDMLESLKHQTPESALARDVGYIPGDGVGTCCADSALWLHVKRNWIWSTQRNMHTHLTSSHILSGIRKKHMEDIKPIKFMDYLKNSVRKPVKFRGGEHSNQQKHRLMGKKKYIKSATMNTKKKKAILRKVKPRKQIPKRTQQVDSIDKGILDKMGKSRAVFCQEEDNIILLCKAVCEFLCNNNRKRSVVNATLRDFIHRMVPYSRKTSKAYKRRYMQLKKSENLQDEQKPFSFNLNSDYFTQKHFKKAKEKLDGTDSVGEVEISITFLYLAYYTYKRWKATKLSATDTIMEDVKDYLTPNKIVKYDNIASVDDDECIYVDPTTEDDINLDTIKSVIHSSLGCQNANQEWPYRLLKVYQSFSEHLLRKALNLLRDQQLISGKRVATKHSGSKEGSILMRGTSYHLSFVYTFKQITKYPNYIYNEAHDLFMSIYKHLSSLKTTGKSIESIDQGHGLGISEIATDKKILFLFDLPDDMISLNPNVGDCDDLIKELALRYNTLMSKKNQDNDEESMPETSDVCKRLESVLKIFIKSQLTENPDQQEKIQKEVDSDLVQIFGDVEPKAQQDEECLLNVDRRQKGLRISDLAFLLAKGLFPELDDDERLEKLNKHFLVRYPSCKLHIEDDCVFENDMMYQMCHKDIVDCSDGIVDRLKKSCIVSNTMPKDEEVREAIERAGGDGGDFDFAERIIRYIYSTNMYGASSKGLKSEFMDDSGNLSLDQILTVLIDIGLVLRVGILNFSFVHYSYRHNWTIFLDSSKNPDFSSDDVGYRVKISPWIRIDGTVHMSVLLNWLNIILSHCLSYPFIPLLSLSKRFCYIKPIDIFYLLEFLQELQCLKMYTYVDDAEEDLFHDRTEVEQVLTKITDDFANTFVETSNTAIIKFGAFLDKDKTVFNQPFEE